MMYYSDSLLHSCTNAMQESVLTSPESALELLNQKRIIANFLHNFTEAYQNFRRAVQFFTIVWDASEVDFVRLAYLGGLSLGNSINLVLMDTRHHESERGDDPFLWLSNQL